MGNYILQETDSHDHDHDHDHDDYDDLGEWWQELPLPPD
jgi:hypothetical protein